MRSSVRNMKGIISIIFLGVLAGCGSSSNSSAVLALSSTSSTYLVEYVPEAAAAEGRLPIKLRVMKRTDGSLVSGLTLTVQPMMYMSSGNSHAAPVDTVVDNGDGSYSCSVYYLMSSMMNGMSSGHWELQVRIGPETVTFYPFVDMAMSNNTARKSLKGRPTSSAA